MCFFSNLVFHDNISAKHGIFAISVLNLICGARLQIPALPGGVTANYTSAIAAIAAGNV